MRHALPLSLLAVLLAGCASEPKTADLNGIWINQAAIDAAVKGDNLRQALLANGPALEWDFDTRNGQAKFSNGFELAEGKLLNEEGGWKVDFYGDYEENLSLKGNELRQAASESGPEQRFARPKENVPTDAPPGTSFEEALYGAYMGGKWRITSGDGQGGEVIFHPDGKVEGLPNLDRYALCLAGDCASMSGEFDSLWLQNGQQGGAWIFSRHAGQLTISEAVNQAQADEMPDLHPGKQRWVLEQE